MCFDPCRRRLPAGLVLASACVACIESDLAAHSSRSQSQICIGCRTEVVMAWLLIPVGVLAVLLAVVGTRFARSGLQKKRDRQRRAEFQIQRERLEAKFFEMASNSGKPRGLRWTDCSFENEITYARQRENG